MSPVIPLKLTSEIRQKLWSSSAARVSIGLAGLLANSLIVAALLGLFPDSRNDALRMRAAFGDTTAIGFALMADRLDTETMRRYLESVAHRNEDVVSMTVRDDGGKPLIEVGERTGSQDATRQDNSPETLVRVPLFANGKPWGAVEIRFEPLSESGFVGYFGSPPFRHGAALTLSCLVIFYFYLRSVLRQLDPSRVVPQRVREALDTLAEGLLVLDRQERIVLANRAFEDATGAARESLCGVSISRLPWVSCDDATAPAPWSEARESGKAVKGRLFGLPCEGDADRTFSVSASPIIDEQGKTRGVLASLEDVTLLERKKRELRSMVDHLRVSSDAIKYQNRELERLATLDPLTECLNRRAFFERFEAEWKSALRYVHDLSVIMVDVDHFKSINDKYGHATGDEVLRQVGNCLRATARESDLICRYGGEEFAVLMPHTDMAQADVGAERIRAAIEELRCGQSTVTASVGVSCLSARRAAHRSCWIRRTSAFTSQNGPAETEWSVGTNRKQTSARPMEKTCAFTTHNRTPSRPSRFTPSPHSSRPSPTATSLRRNTAAAWPTCVSPRWMVCCRTAVATCSRLLHCYTTSARLECLTAFC